MLDNALFNKLIIYGAKQPLGIASIHVYIKNKCYIYKLYYAFSLATDYNLFLKVRQNQADIAIRKL